ncbi:MAG: 1-pyrroline-5-carboxylate dehydrogenase [Candidatus Micrarchaeota archaeon]|nr:MAG: 1-pyrroline-5-carboxylate dehydrogenase [Candidatus Micrarchaeota archaeon]
MAFENEFTYRKYLEAGKEEEFDKLFEAAVEKVKSNFGGEYPIVINGEPIYTKDKMIESSPIDNRWKIGIFQRGDREIARKAIDAALEAFKEWSQVDYRKRAEIFKKAADIFAQNKFELAAVLSIENGKSRYESIGEVDEAIDFLRYYSMELIRNKGYNRRDILKGSTRSVKAGFQGAPSPEEVIDIRMVPYGVFGVIAPFNFPVSISTGMSSGAMITGNTVVFKPSSSDNMTMLTGYYIYKLLKEAGLPEGVFNYLTGPGSEVGDELVVNDKVSGIVFTGSRETGMGMLAKVYGSKKQKIFVVEMGGKNPTIVSKTADLDIAAKGIVSAAFGFAGQKCSALSRVYVHSSVKGKLLDKIIALLKDLKIGDPLKKENYIGPLISKSAYDRYVTYVDHARKNGRVIYGGNTVDVGLNGYYVEPTIVEIDHDDEMVHKELFVPILVVIGYDDFNDALRMANDVEYGLTAGLYSKDKKEIKLFADSIEAGVVYINRESSATTGAIVGHHSFVGWKGSGITGKGTGSRFYLQQFLREKSVSITK